MGRDRISSQVTSAHPQGPGLRLARAYFTDVVAPIVADAAPGLRYGAALIGPGSEVLGFDTAMSTDHDFGPRAQLFLPVGERRRDAVVARLDDGLPAEFRGFPTRFNRSSDPPDRPDPPHHVAVTDIVTWSRAALGTTAGTATGTAAGTDIGWREWLAIGWQRLAEATAGAVFRDDLGELDRMRRALAWYPDDMWRVVLARQWRRIADEEAFVGRTGDVGDDLGSAVLTARLVRDLMCLAMLLNRRYPPYSKWLGTAFARLPDADVLTPMLTSAMRATAWRGRETALCRAYEHLGRTQNALGLCAHVDPACRGYFDRPFRVLGADRFIDALRAAITDPQLRAAPV